MIDYSEALEILRSRKPIALEEEVDIEVALGRTLSADILAVEASPPFDNSAMDGFAIASTKTKNATTEAPAILSVGQCLAAGDQAIAGNSLSEAVEIMTGAPMPVGDYDTVVKIEDVTVSRDANRRATHISINKPVQPNQNIRRSGEDFQVGQTVLKAGQTVELAHLMALATLGISKIKVAVQPKIALISTGKELVSPSTPQLKPGQIRNSTAIYIRKYLEQMKYTVIDGGTVDDDPKNFRKHIEDSLNAGAQIIVSTGAVSMGQFDFVKPTLEKMGAKVHFHKCAIRPGKPILFASANWNGQNVFFFGVPGNPVSTAVGLRFFVRPFLDNWIGRLEPSVGPARLANDFKKPNGLRCFYKAVENINESGERVIEILPGQASFMVSPLIKANAWAIFDESNKPAQSGSMVEVSTL